MRGNWSLRKAALAILTVLVVTGALYESYTYAFNRGYKFGYSKGYEVGHDDGYKVGREAGYNAGFVIGNSTGYKTGYRIGYDAGYNTGYEDGNKSGYRTGYDTGYNSGYTDGFRTGNATGFKLGNETGYITGYRQGVIDGAGRGYTIRDPTYLEVLQFLKIDQTDKNEYNEENYTCINFAADFKNNAFKAGYRCGYVEIEFPEHAHAIVCFNTTDHGLIFIEPQTDEIVNPIIGLPYWNRAIYEPPDYDDTIVRIIIVW